MLFLYSSISRGSAVWLSIALRPRRRELRRPPLPLEAWKRCHLHSESDAAASHTVTSESSTAAADNLAAALPGRDRDCVPSSTLIYTAPMHPAPPRA